VTRYISLAEFWNLAEHVTGIEAATLIKASRVDLADSALHAPQAGFGDTDFYPDVIDKDVDDSVEAMIAVLARDVDEAWLANWLRERVLFTD
jgi:death on curing protein